VSIGSEVDEAGDNWPHAERIIKDIEKTTAFNLKYQDLIISFSL
jgi:hypothetical protein